jgi:PilZ domain
MLTQEWKSARVTEERRRSHRSPISWPVRLWLGENLFTPARAVNISRGGICIRLSPSVSLAILRLGQGYRIEICPGFADDFFCLAEVRYLHDHGVGLAIKETLPLARRGSQPALLR